MGILGFYKARTFVVLDCILFFLFWGSKRLNTGVPPMLQQAVAGVFPDRGIGGILHQHHRLSLS